MATTTKKKKVTKKPRKKKRAVVSAHVHIQATFNNTIVSITDTKGNLLMQTSAGSQGFKGSRKSTAYAAQIAADAAIKKAVEQFGVKKVDISVKGIGQGRESAIRAFGNYDIQVLSIQEKTAIPHNGCRPRKVRKP